MEETVLYKTRIKRFDITVCTVKFETFRRYCTWFTWMGGSPFSYK